MSQATKSSTERTVTIASLTPDPANLRLHDERGIAAIAASLKRFGQQKPIVVDASNVVIAGHGVLEAAKLLGWSKIRVVKSDLTGAERIAYGIADNRLAELSEWDDDGLRRVLGGLGSDLSDIAGFSTLDLQQLMAEAESDAALAADQVPEPPAAAITKPGDLWILGDHRLLCGDCTNAEHVRRLMDGRRAVLFATDPPYLVGYDGTNHPQSYTNGESRDWSETYGRTWDDADANADLYDRFITTAVAEAIAADAAWYCWHASRRQAMLEAAWIKSGAFVHCQIIWAKNRPVLTRSWYMWQHEPCLFGWVKKPKKVDSEFLSTVWNFDTIPNGDERPDHPTPKPLETFAIPMRQHTGAGDVCYEPFSGSGTQIIVAEQLGRRCCAVEIEPRYVDVAVMRWQALTGKSARLDGTDLSFDQIRATACPASPNAPAATPDAAPLQTAPTAPPTPPSTPAPRGRARKPRPTPAATAASGSACG